MTAYVKIGNTKKSYGVKGDLRIFVESAYEPDLRAVDVVFLDINGRKVPYFIEQVYENAGLMVKFEEVDSKEAALKLSNKEIFLRKEDLRSDQKEVDLPLTQLVGFHLEDLSVGKIGPIVDVLEMPQQIMAVVEYEGKELLIPLNDQFIQAVFPEKELIQMDLPEGILDL